MSSIAVTASASGTGVVSLQAPVTSTNRTITLPDSTGTIATAESTLAQFNATGAAPVYACRAWVNFNGTGVVAVRASGNVSSITDNGTGDYTANFTTAMPDANYAVTGTGESENLLSMRCLTPQHNSRATTSIRMITVFANDSRVDSTIVNVAIFR